MNVRLSVVRISVVRISDLSLLSAGRSIACPIRMSLYIFLLYYIILIIYALRVSIFMTSPLGVDVGLLSI